MANTVLEIVQFFILDKYMKWFVDKIFHFYPIFLKKICKAVLIKAHTTLMCKILINLQAAVEGSYKFPNYN